MGFKKGQKITGAQRAILLARLAKAREARKNGMAGKSNPPNPSKTMWKPYSYFWSNGYGPIPEKPLTERVFNTKKACEDWWYDTAPGSNERMVPVRIVGGKPVNKNLQNPKKPGWAATATRTLIAKKDIVLISDRPNSYASVTIRPGEKVKVSYWASTGTAKAYGNHWSGEQLSSYVRPDDVKSWPKDWGKGNPSNNPSFIGDTVTSMFPVADMDRMQKGIRGDLKRVGKLVSGKGRKNSKNNPESGKKRNSKDAYSLSSARSEYESFHGAASTKTATVTETEYIPTHLAELGLLVSIDFKPITGGPTATIEFDTDNKDKRVHLCVDPITKGMYFTGGDQSISLAPIGLGAKQYQKPLMDIGTVTQITYRTKKGFDNFQDIHYWHKLGEETKEKPTLLYAPTIQRLYLAGGAYKIRPEGIVN